MESARLEEDRKITEERVAKNRRIQAERLEADRARLSRLAAEYLREDAVQAKLIADERAETDRRLAAEGLGDLKGVIAAERLKVDTAKAALVASEREKAAGIQADEIKAERFNADMQRVLGFMEANRRLAAERREADRRLDRLIHENPDAVRRRSELLAGRRLTAERMQNAGQDNDSRKHRRTVDSKEKVELIMEMKRVFAEHFEEKHGAKTMVSELYHVFARSTRLSSFRKGDFTFHSKNVFMIIWPDVHCSTFRHNRCFVGVAAK